jgi:CubicO group peptidase (beta-lactamase class C family)
MADSTFRPTPAQLTRLVKTYRAGADGVGLEEAPIAALTYPLDDARRQPIPGGGLFSTAPDMLRFGQMILSRGTLHGRRYVSEESVAEMAKRQTGDSGPDEFAYGLGWQIDGESCWHWGSLTNVLVDFKHKLVIVFNSPITGGTDGRYRIFPIFKKAVTEKYGK